MQELGGGGTLLDSVGASDPAVREGRKDVLEGDLHSGTVGRCLLDWDREHTVCSDPLALAFPRALTSLYEDPEWSQKDLAGPTESLKTQVTKSKLGVLAPSQLQRYRQELAERARLGHPPCFTNLWALISEGLLHEEVRGGAWPGHSWEMGSSPGQQGGQRSRAPESHSLRLESSPSTSPVTAHCQTSGRP